MKPLIWLESDFNPWPVDDTQYSHDTSHNARAFYELGKFDGVGDDSLEDSLPDFYASWGLPETFWGLLDEIVPDEPEQMNFSFNEDE